MGKLLSALLNLQSIEHRIAEVNSRLRIRKNAVSGLQKKIDELQEYLDSLQDQIFQKRKESDQIELDLKSSEEKVDDLRGVLNTAKTNKEYAAILTQINTLKADNAKLEEDALKIMQTVDTLKVQAEQIKTQLETEQQKLEEANKINATEITRLESMIDELTDKRTEATQKIPPEQLILFERIAKNQQGDAMAAMEVHGTKPPYSYVCGGCFMGLNAEHANALKTKDEIRTCDTCGRILYLPKTAEVEKQNS